MIKKEERAVKQTVMVDVICNKCGESMVQNKSPNDRIHCHGLVHGVVRGQYGSKHLEDMTAYLFSICEGCLKELFTTFKIPPTEKEYMWNTGEIIGG